jgi:hypothetical protein
MPPVRPFEVPALLLRRASESRPPAVGPEDYDVIGKDGEVIGRIMRAATGPAGKTLMWSLATRRDVEGPSSAMKPRAMPPCRRSREAGIERKGNVACPTRDEFALAVAILPNVRGTSWREKPRQGVWLAGFRGARSLGLVSAVGIMSSLSQKATVLCRWS